MRHGPVQDIIERLQLQALHGEGGWFRRTGAGGVSVSGRPAWTRILYLLTSGAAGFSELHRLDAPEEYFFYFGDAVEMLLLHPDGRAETVLLGPKPDAGQKLRVHVPAGVWQGLRMRAGGAYALLGTTMTPGYWPEGYEAGKREPLCQKYPGQVEQIKNLTRNVPGEM